MLPTSYFTAWGAGALYAELYIGLCRVLAAPWLNPWGLGSRPGARRCPPAPSGTPAEVLAAEPAPAATAALSQPQSTGALIIPFERARARHGARPEAIPS